MKNLRQLEILNDELNDFGIYAVYDNIEDCIYLTEKIDIYEDHKFLISKSSKEIYIEPYSGIIMSILKKRINIDSGDLADRIKNKFELQKTLREKRMSDRTTRYAKDIVKYTGLVSSKLVERGMNERT